MIPEPLSASVKGSFAYKTVKDRLPIIVTKAVDVTQRQIPELAEHQREELKRGLAELSKMRYLMSTDKPLEPIETKDEDASDWERLFQEMTSLQGFPPSWFKSPWLFVECYMYRRIANVFETCTSLPGFDPFQFFKDESFITALSGIVSLVQFEEKALREILTKEQLVSTFLQISLWGNRFDLSISIGESRRPDRLLHEIEDLRRDCVLVDQLTEMTSYLVGLKAARLDIVMDNAGYELMSDLCLADILLETRIANVVTLHVKKFSWFVSDTTSRDLNWTLELCRLNPEKELSDFAKKIHTHLESGRIIVKADPFYTLSCDFTRLQEFAPKLLADLTKSGAVIFKGDLNYRKLVGDLAWPHSATFKEALRSNPLIGKVPIIALRTCKADVVVQLDKNLVEKVAESDHDWMVTGKYAVTHFLKE